MRTLILAVLGALAAGCVSVPQAMVNGDGVRQAVSSNEFDIRIIAVDGDYLSSAMSRRAPITPGRRVVVVESLQPPASALDERRHLPQRRSIDLDVSECTEIRLKAVHEPYWSSRFEVKVVEVRELAGCKRAELGDQPSA